MLDTKMTSWPNSSSAPYGDDFEKYAIDLISLLKNEMGFNDKIFSRIIFSIPGRAMEKFKKGADKMFQNGFPGAFDAYLETSYPSSAKQYVDDAEKWGANFLGIGVDSFLMEKVQKELGSIPIYPPNSWWAWVAEMSNRRDQTRKIKKVYFWTVDNSVNQRQALDYGVDGIISNWPSRVRIIIQSPPYNRYYRMASPNDPIK
jgi:glycerophosphoryl diester phosphodiesterase